METHYQSLPCHLVKHRRIQQDSRFNKFKRHRLIKYCEMIMNPGMQIVQYIGVEERLMSRVEVKKEDA